MKTSVDYFKFQAKNFFRDFKTQELGEDGLYHYKPRFFDDIEDIIVSFDIDENRFCLMNAQHLIAHLSGFYNWSDLIRAEQTTLEIGRLLLEYRINSTLEYPTLEEWQYYIRSVEQINGPLDEESKLSLLRIFLGLDTVETEEEATE